MNVTSISTTTRKKEIIPLPFVRLSDVNPQPIKWLWKPYIPCAGVSMIVGDGGYGKSIMTCSITADLSAGRALPDQAALPPQRILMISAEDGLSQIMLPRIKAQGGDLSMIAAYDEGFSIDKNMADRIAAAVSEFDAAVVFLDPMVVYMGGEIDFFKANEVRSIMDRLTAIAREKNIAIVGVHHVRKAFAPTAQHRTLGSVDFINGVRSAMLVDITKRGTYYMQHIKHNWSKAGPSLAYNVVDDKFSWLGEMHLIEDAVDFQVSHTPRGKCRAFIKATLKNGPIPSLEFIKLARDEGFSERTINRAKKGIARSVEKVDNGVKKWFWELEEGQEPRPETDVPDLVQFAGAEPLTITPQVPQELVDEALRRLEKHS
jgi:hypothetical protein